MGDDIATGDAWEDASTNGGLQLQLELVRKFEMKASRQIRNGHRPNGKMPAETVIALDDDDDYNGDAEVSKLRAENEALRAELQRRSEDSEGRLRKALNTRGISTKELRQAIMAVESLVDQARRELGNAEVRERRAAYEALHHAMEKGEEEELEVAIQMAMLADVSQEDVQKGEVKLAELRALTPEQKAAKKARQLENVAKKEAFILIKRDDAQGLEALIQKLDESVRWKDWRDYNARTLWRCSLDLRATRVQSFLAPLVGQRLPEETMPSKYGRSSVISTGLGHEEKRPSGSLSSPSNANTRLFKRQTSHSSANSGSGSASPLDGSPAMAAQLPPAVIDVSNQMPEVSMLPHAASMDTPCSPPPRPAVASGAESETAEGSSPSLISPARSEAEYDKLKVMAFRAVAQDDCAALAEVLENVHQDIWNSWQNKAGDDLLTLSQRKTGETYSMLARELGMLKEVVREKFEEGQAVWIFVHGEVQPRQATVQEDSPIEEDDVLVEFWDGNEAAVRVDRCLITKVHGFS